MKLTDEQKRIRIAEACGWIFIVSHDRQGVAVPDRWENLEGFEFFEDMPLPSYLTSLDAMAEAEKTLTAKQREEYAWALCPLDKGGAVSSCLFPAVHATAAQRAEAFLRTIGEAA